MKKKVLYSAPAMQPMVIELEENLAFTRFNQDGNENLGDGEEEDF